MPANSGAITGTKAHKHSAPSADGGFLDDTVTGVTGTSNGSLVMFDGSSIAQDLPAGNLNDVLTMGAAVPAWSAGAAASSFEFISSSTLGAAATEIDITFASIDCDDISELFCVFVGGFSSSSEAHLQINGITASNYFTFGTHSNNGISPNPVVNSGAQAYWILTSNLSGGDWKGGTSTFHIRGGTSTASPTTSSEASFSSNGSDMLPNSSWALGGSLRHEIVNSFDQVRVFADGVANLTAGSKLSIYRLNSS